MRIKLLKDYDQQYKEGIELNVSFYSPGSGIGGAVGYTVHQTDNVLWLIQGDFKRLAKDSDSLLKDSDSLLKEAYQYLSIIYRCKHIPEGGEQNGNEECIYEWLKEATSFLEEVEKPHTNSNKKEILKKIDSNKTLTNKELEEGIAYFSNLVESLKGFGVKYSLVYNNANKELERLKNFKLNRGI